jgi:Protein of unknown function (DUF2567)
VVSSLPPAQAGPPARAPENAGAFRLGSSAPIPAAALWRGRAELRDDLRSAVTLAGVLLLSGLPAGLLWWWLAPRADFRITADGPVAIGRPSNEISVADDSVLVLILAALGLLAGGLAWLLRRRRGVATVAALAAGTLAAAVVAWQVGELLGPPPTPAELADVGGVVTTPLSLAGVPALAVAPFAAVLAYLVAVLMARTDDLGRAPGSGVVAPAEGSGAGEEQPVDARG